MQKTKEITFEGAAATISSDYAPKKVSVTVKEPNITEIFESIHEKDLVAYVKDKFAPGEIFDEKHLIDWANDNGYIEEE